MEKEFRVLEEYTGTYCEECGTRVDNTDFFCEHCQTADHIEDRSLKLCEECGRESEVFYDSRECPLCGKEYF